METIPPPPDRGSGLKILLEKIQLKMVWCWFDKELNPNFDWDWAWQFQFFQNISDVMMGKRTSRILGMLRISRIRLLLGITKISGKSRISDILTLFVPTLLDSSRVPGGADLPTLELLPSDDKFTIFFKPEFLPWM